jgi:murein DD-endopeptidase MepM/ murein hydrolase activator NlpD
VLHGAILTIAMFAGAGALATGTPGFQPADVLTTPYRAAPSQGGYLGSSALAVIPPSILERPHVKPDAPAAPKPASGPSATPTPAQPAFSTYTIQSGDTISSIAAGFGIYAQYILWNNPETTEDPDTLVVGGVLLIPTVNGIVYNVRLGDTLSDLAAFYGIDLESITGFSGNNIASPDSVIEGMVLMLPGAEPPAPAPAPEPAPEPLAAPASVPEPAGAPAPASSGFIWPFYGNITQYYSAAHPGIDIDGCGRDGAPIVAAASGQVVLTARETWGFGYYVVVRHPDGSQTQYSHLSDIWVSQGQFVSQGEAVGGMGNTGYVLGGCGGTHLDFRLFIGGVPVDPLAYLP